MVPSVLWVVFVAVLSALIRPSHQRNSPPDFVPSGYRGGSINENTPVGQVLGQYTCIDADGDTIKYSVIGGDVIAVNPTTGEVTLNRKLDREESSDFGTDGKPIVISLACIDVDAADNEISSAPVENSIEITILDNNDEAPVFDFGADDFKISESAPPGTTLDAKITVTDRDEGLNAKLQSFSFYCPQNPEPCNLFQLEYIENNEGLYTGYVVLKQSVDFETKKDYNINIRAVDGAGTDVHNTASGAIQINILDSQDTNPAFQMTSYLFGVDEELAVDSETKFELSARDMDTGARRRIAFEILGDEQQKLFRAGPSRLADADEGIYAAPVIVNSLIDRETFGSRYTFTAKATELDESGNPTDATVTTEITVQISDVNDNKPEFSQEMYSAQVPEMSNQGGNSTYWVPNLYIEVIDPDERNNARYTVEILSQTFNGAFGITPDEPVEGQQDFFLIFNNLQFIDYENPDFRSQKLVLRAVETTPERFSSTATVLITITDRNDNTPKFEQDLYETSLSETSRDNPSVLVLKATDKDSGSNGEVEYRLPSSIQDTFQIDNTTGVISLLGTLNFEAKSLYTFVAYAVDKGDEPRTADTSVLIRVTDYNEEGPQFTSDSYTGRISESSLAFLDPVRVEAVDSSDTTANITYRILSGNTPTNSFVLNSFTGELTLREQVTHEQTLNRSGIFSLVVEASDNGNPPITAQIGVTVTVLDENNNRPVFSPVQYYNTTSEAERPGTFVVRVTATDADYGTNGNVFYSIGSGGRDSFVVDPDGTVRISYKPNIDYDETKSLEVEVIATDGGSPQHSATATVYVTITDANNKPPTFVQSSYNKVIDEASPKGFSVLQVSATDPDSVHKLEYTILENTIVAVSKGGAIVQGISLYNYPKLFAVDPNTGVITVSETGPGLDYDFVAEMTFQVQAEDVDPSATSRQVAEAYVSINIIGTPETELYFTGAWRKDDPKYRLMILETAEVGRDILTLQARDPAYGGRLVPYYEEVPFTDEGDYFRIISDTGGVILNRALDYESNNLVHTVVARAIQDPTPDYGSRTVSATIIVQVQDSNDNPPQFTRQKYDFTVREGVNVNYKVGTITAYDRDSASFGAIEFILGVDKDRNHFRLYQNPETAGNSVSLLVAQKLDYEKRDFYSIEVIAKDNKNSEGARLESRAQVNIRVIDENDNVPTFSDESRSFSVAETAPIDKQLGQLLARDDDFGLNGEIEYTLLADGSSNKVDPLSLFRVTTRGYLVTRDTLQGKSGTYKMLVMAKDKGLPPQSSSIPITVKVQGVEDNDGTPKWVLPVDPFVYVTEHNKTKLDIELQAIARTPNADVIYSFYKYGTDYLNFTIDPDTGDINVTADLDWEVQRTYTLLVEAKDTIDEAMLSQRIVTVYLIDIDDNAPSFRKSSYEACPNEFEVPTVFTTPDGTPKDTIVAHAVACDPDGPGHDKLYYYMKTQGQLCQNNHYGAFRVLVNGSVQTTRWLDYEERQEYLVCVEVKANPVGAGKRRKREFDVQQMTDTDTTAYIIIRVTDVNDNGPRFTDEDVPAVLETIPSEEEVVRVLAVDPDGPLNNQVVYTISSVMYYPPGGGSPFSMAGAFAINPENGMITANLPSYYSFAPGYFQLEVQAFDSQNRQFNDSIMVSVFVYQRTQVLRMVLNRPPAQGQIFAEDLISDLKEAGRPEKDFHLIKVSEHRTGSIVDQTKTDVCFVIVENKRVLNAGQGIGVLDSSEFKDVVTNAKMVDRGTCYPLMSTRDKVKWDDLWWVLVVIAVFIFICTIILIVVVCILYDRYKSYMDSRKTYLMPQ